MRFGLGLPGRPRGLGTAVRDTTGPDGDPGGYVPVSGDLLSGGQLDPSGEHQRAGNVLRIHTLASKNIMLQDRQRTGTINHLVMSLVEPSLLTRDEKWVED